MRAPEPREFFEQTIPALFEEARVRMTEAQRAVRAAFGFAVHGAGGGAWTIRFEAGELRLEGGLASDCLIIGEQPLWAWRTAWTEAGRLGNDPIGQLVRGPDRLKPEWLDNVRRVKGTLRAELVDGDDPVWEITVRFGAGPAEAQTVITAPMATAEEIRSGRLQPQQALLGGRLKIRGDINLAMQAGALAMLR